MTHNASCDVSNCDHTKTPWYVTWCELYDEIHIQSAPEDCDNHVLTMSYRHSSSCPAHPDYKSNAQCAPSECEGLREAMCNAKLIVESDNEKTFGGQLLINQSMIEEEGV